MKREREKGKGEEPKATCARNKKKRKKKQGAVCFSGAKVWADHHQKKKKNIQALYNPENLKIMGSNDESLVLNNL
jgi:hypothetical protein